MTAERHELVKRAFLAARDLPPDRRDGAVREVCGDDEILRAEVRSLLRVHDEGDADFLSRPALGAAVHEILTGGGPRPDPPPRVPGCRIERELGRGGMGTVYLAIQEDGGLNRRVAVKVVKRGMDTDEVLRRFHLERRVLASLNHPNIARLLDAGATDDGRPYFVMEHVEGLPIDEHCRRARLTVEERLNLFARVCDAVHHAHQNLVVHRDIKPGNILVTPEGEPKLVDFGIARLLNPELSPFPASPTAPAMRYMTPEYASPEQIRGEAITTATDVYSLGVVLYVLLTGRQPYRLRTRLREEIERIICEQEPERPSTSLSHPPDLPLTAPAPAEAPSLDRSADRRLRRRLEGDVDTIVLHAMQKSPERRYRSAQQLGDDVRRHLEGMPVAARPDTALYRAGKFVRRNRAAVAAASIAILLVAGFAGAALWQAREADSARARAEAQRELARQRLEDVRSLAHVFVHDVYDAVATVPGATRARAIIVESAKKYLDRLATTAGDDAPLLGELADAYERLADVQGSPRSGNLGDHAAALALVTSARGLRDRAAAIDGSDESRDAVWQSTLRSGDLHARLGDLPAAAREYAGAVSLAEARAAAGTEDPERQRALAVSLVELAEVKRRQGDIDRAQELFERAVGVLDAAVKARPGDERLVRSLSVANNGAAEILTERQQHAEAQRRLRSVVEAREHLAALAPGDARAERDLAVARCLLAVSLRRTGDAAEARDLASSAQRAIEALRVQDAADVRLAETELKALEALAGAAADLDDEAAASEAHRRLQRLAEPLAAEGNNIARRSLMWSASVRASAALESGDCAEALEQCRRSLALARAERDRAPASARSTRNLALALEQLADAHACAGQTDEALRRYGEAVATALGVSPGKDPGTLRRQAMPGVKAGRILAAAGRHAEAGLVLNGAREALLAISASVPDDTEVRGLLAEISELLSAGEGASPSR